MIGQILGENSFSVKDAVRDMINGDEPISKETVREFLRSLFFSGIEQEKDTFFKLLLLILIAAVLANFADAFENGQVGDVSFYVVYLILFMSLVENFSRLSTSLSTRLSWLAEFMKVLSPAYFMAVTASVGASSAVVFYEGVLLMVWAIQWLLVNVFLPGVNLCILLKLVNHLSKEEMLSKMAELLEIAVNWGLKTLLGAAVGLQIVRNLVTPVMDSLKRSALGKNSGSDPGDRKFNECHYRTDPDKCGTGEKQSGSCVSDPAGTCGNGACHTLWCFVSFLSFSGSSFPACIR